MIPEIWIAALFYFGTVEANEVCYEKIGCFSDKPPWGGLRGRHLLGLPQSPESMNISYSLFTRETGNISQSPVLLNFPAPMQSQHRLKKISTMNTSTLQNSYFSPRRKTSFVIHGFESTGKYGWVVEMCLLLVKMEDINCFAVDWEEGAKCTYFIAASNIRVLGAEIAYLINTFAKMYRYCPSRVHLIGHSLGAHTAGEAGRRIRGTGKTVPGIGRITGLDPAGFCFDGFPAMVRLDPTDAIFVDVIHTNGAKFPKIGFGMLTPCGDLDFYPNGGTSMPGCDPGDILLPENDSGALTKALAIGNCHHSRSYQYYMSSILYPDGFLGYPCKSYKDFEKGDCFPCPKEGCPMMGQYADRFRYKLRRNNTKYYLNTGPKEPFTSWMYNISVKLDGMTKTKGEIYIVFYSENGNATEYQIASGSLQKAHIYSKLTNVEINPVKAKAIEFIWHKKFSTFLWAKLGAERVTLTRGQDGHEFLLCGNGTVLYGVPQTLAIC